MWDVLREVVLDIFGCSKFHTYSVFYGFTKKCSEVLPKSYETNMRKLKEELGKYMEVCTLKTSLDQLVTNPTGVPSNTGMRLVSTAAGVEFSSWESQQLCKKVMTSHTPLISINYCYII